MGKRIRTGNGWWHPASVLLWAVIMTGLALPARAQLERVVADARGIT